MVWLAGGLPSAPTPPTADCPLTCEELGHDMWAFLHATAAGYPKNPSETEQERARALVESTSQLYPCRDCAKYLRASLKSSPPEVASRETFAAWVCKTHSQVNKLQGQPSYSCDDTPLTTEALGQSTWGLLHTTAAHYPTSPTEADQAFASSLMQSVGTLYPCASCKDSFRASLDSSPPEVTSREKISAWLCKIHNQVNLRLGKPAYTCDHASLDARWGTGRPMCSIMTMGKSLPVEPAV